MIGEKISTALGKVFKKARPFDPEKPRGVKEPQTLRELMYWDDKVPVPQEIPQLHFNFMSGQRGVRFCEKTPVDLKSLTAPRPAPHSCPSAVNSDVYRFFYEWLKKKRIVKGLDIDHFLTMPKPWPIVDRLDEELVKRTGMDLECYFGMIDTEEDESDPFYVAYMPIYDCSCDDDYVPLLEFLESRGCSGGHLPEAALEVYKEYHEDDAEPERTMDMAACVFWNIYRQKKWNLLPEPWNNAMKFLFTYHHPLGFDEWEQAAVHLHNVDAIDDLFYCGKLAADMRAAVDPLVRIADDTGEMWLCLVEHLLEVVKKYPKLGTKNEKVKTKVRVTA